MGTFKDLTGNKYNRLTVLSLSHVNTVAYWKCLCDCGKKATVITVHLKNGHTKSCGCLKTEVHTTHGFVKTPTYNVWQNMVQRCVNPNYKRYYDYGGRGIVVCCEWVDSFETFMKDMGEKPKGLTLDRKDNNKGYNKENCQWISNDSQQNNKRNNVNITYNDKTQTLTQWAKELNLNPKTLTNRLFRSKWTIEKAFSKQINK